MTSTVGDRYALELELIGPWHEVDLDRAVGDLSELDDGAAALREWLQMPSAPTGVERLLSAVLIDPPADSTSEPPLYASLLVTRLDGPALVPASAVHGRELTPERTTRRSVFAVPGSQERVHLHHVRYVLAPPQGACAFVLEFATPNLPLVSELEYAFDVVMSTVVLHPLDDEPGDATD